MSRRTRMFYVIAMALLTAGIATAAVHRATVRAAARLQPRSDYVVVAARELPIGTRISAADVKVVAWPATAPVAGGFSDPAMVVGRGAIGTLLENEPVTESRIAAVGAGAGLPPAIPPGMRAISVRAEDMLGVARFVQPGMRVDVLVTLRDRGSEGGITRITASNVQVLATGTRDQQQAQQGSELNTVTLLVSPADAERITLAAAEGKIMLTLRNPLDTAETVTTGARVTNLLEIPIAPTSAPQRQTPSSAPPRAAAAAVSPEVAAPRTYTVETIRDGKRLKETLR